MGGWVAEDHVGEGWLVQVEEPMEHLGRAVVALQWEEIQAASRETTQVERGGTMMATRQVSLFHSQHVTINLKMTG